MNSRFFSSKRNLFLILTLVSICLLVLSFLLPAAGQDKNKKHSLSRQSSFEPDGTLMNINNISMWIYANGESAFNPDGDWGVIYPRGTAGVVFADGLIWGGKVKDGSIPEIRVGGQTYGAGTVGGIIASEGVPVFEDRIWRVRRDYATADLVLDAAEVNQIAVPDVNEGHIDALRAQYRADWREWPAEKGAPFYDAGNDGLYNPEFTTDVDGFQVPVLYPEADEPGIANADQVVWLAANDLDSTTVLKLYGSPPIGLEMQLTLWGYKRADALGNVIFKQYRLIYKGTENTPLDARIDSMHFAQWSDPDLGSFGDDLVGCDILLDLGYVYNSSTQDQEFGKFNLPPPAVGYDILGGPIVPGSFNEAIFDLKKRLGFRNLPMTTFAFYGAGGQDSDPTLGGNYNGTLQWWNLLRGSRPRPETPPQPWVDPTTAQITKFRVPGDPVTGIGWIDANPGTRRLLFASGPFNLSLGDTNEINIALVGGLGGDRLLSITAMKHYARVAQQTFDNLFEMPKPPPTPSLTATELDGEILLNWSNSQTSVESVEQWREVGFRFEGYNVYQLQSPFPFLVDATKLATFDLKNEVTTIIQPQFDPKSAAVLDVPVQIGTNSGLFRTMLIQRDEIQGFPRPLVNGQEYYFAVTSYSFNPDPQAAIKSLESPPAIVTVKPQWQKPGETLSAVMGDTLPVVHSDGVSDGKVFPVVIDPTKLTGDSYQVIFQGSDDDRVWHLINSSSGDTLLKDQTNQSGDDNYLIVDGFTPIVMGSPRDFKSFQLVANAAGAIEPPLAAAFASQGFPTPGSADPSPAGQANGQRWAIHTGADAASSAGGARGSYSAFLSRSLRGNNFNRVLPFDWEMRFTSRGSWAVKAFRTGELLKVPFELWNIGVNTPDDPSDDYRLIPWFLELSALGFLEPDSSYGLTPNDHPASGQDDDPYTQWIYWRIPAEHLDNLPGETGYNNYLAAIDTADVTGYGSYGVDGSEAFARMVLICWNCDDVSDGALDPGVARTPEQGTVFRLLTNKFNTASDIFTFSTADFAPTFSTEQAREDIKAIKVFPNPYYGLFRFDSGPGDRYVTFTHLPQKAVVRVFTLAGALVRTFTKEDESQFLRWDLLNETGRLVASGVYIVHIEMSELGVSKILKLAVFPK